MSEAASSESMTAASFAVDRCWAGADEVVYAGRIAAARGIDLSRSDCYTDNDSDRWEVETWTAA